MSEISKILKYVAIEEMAYNKKDFLNKAFLFGEEILINLIKIYYFEDRAINHHCSEIDALYKKLCDMGLKSGTKKNLDKILLKEMLNPWLDNQADYEYKSDCLKTPIKNASEELKRNAGKYGIPPQSGISEQELHEKILNVFYWIINNICNSKFISVKQYPELKEMLNPVD